MSAADRLAVARLSDDALEVELERANAALTEAELAEDGAAEDRLLDRIAAIEAEQDARELATSDDDRVRESVGVYR